MQVHIAFQEGFANDDVVVRVDGREVARESGLRAQDPMIPFSASRDVQVEPASGALSVEVPTKGLAKTFQVNFGEGAYLGIALVGNEITVRRSTTPFQYL